MPKYLDHHVKLPLIPPEVKDRALARVQAYIQAKRADKFGVTPLNVIVGANGEAWCLTEAPNAEAVIKSHEAAGSKLSRYDIVEVKTLA